MESYLMGHPSSSSLLMGVPNPLSSLVVFSEQPLAPNHIKDSPSQITKPHQKLTSFEAYGLFARLSSTFSFWLTRQEWMHIQNDMFRMESRIYILGRVTRAGQMLRNKQVKH